MSDSDDAFQSADEGENESKKSSRSEVRIPSEGAESPATVTSASSMAQDEDAACSGKPGVKQTGSHKEESKGAAGKHRNRKQKKNKKRQAADNSRKTGNRDETEGDANPEDCGSSHGTTEDCYSQGDNIANKPEKEETEREKSEETTCSLQSEDVSEEKEAVIIDSEPTNQPVDSEAQVTEQHKFTETCESNVDPDVTGTQAQSQDVESETVSGHKVKSSEEQPVKEERREPTPTRKIERHSREEIPAEEHQQILDRLSGAAEKPKPESGSWGWGGWGSSWGSSLLSTATHSVATFTSQVGEGVKTVMETVESTIGAPDPAELARQARASKVKEPLEGANGHGTHSEEEPDEEELAKVAEGPLMPPEGSKDDTIENESLKKSEAEADEASGPGDDSSSWFSSWGVSGISKAVEKTGKTLVTGSLDVLETIGKKTYEIVAEGDHGLKQQLRNTGNKPNLSVMLREAAKDAEERSKQEEEYEEARQAHFGSLFDEYNGLAHLEALELLANQSEGRVHTLLSSLSPEQVHDVKPDLINIKELFQVDESDDESEEEPEQDFGQLMTEHYGNLGVNISPELITEVEDKTRQWLKDCQEQQDAGEPKPPKELHQRSIQALAKLTACSIQHFHKIGQLLQMDPQGPMAAFTEKAIHLSSILKVIGMEVDILSSKFTASLNTAADDSEDPDAVTPLITNVYLEASNSKTYLQDAFQLLLPVVQNAAIFATTKS